MTAFLRVLIACSLMVNASLPLAAPRVLEMLPETMGTGPVSLTKFMETLEDETRALTLPDVRSPAQASRFRNDLPATAVLQIGRTHSAHWFRITLRNPGSVATDAILQIGYARISLVDFYAPNEEGSYQVIATGSSRRFDTRPLPSRFFAFPVTVPAKAERTYFIRLQSDSGLFVPARLWSPLAYHQGVRNDYLGQSWYFGIATAMALFNLLLFAALGDRIYLLYVGFVTCTSLTLAAQLGLASEFLWPAATLWSDIAPQIGFSLSSFSLLIFMRHMLDTRANLPRFDAIIRLLAGTLLLTLPLYAHSMSQFQSFGILLYTLTMLLVLGVGIYCCYKRQRAAYFFTLAFFILIMSAFLVILTGLGFVPANPLTINSLQLGSTAEMLLLAFALADRFNMIRHERSRAQSEAFQAQQRLVETLKSSERMLEERVSQRTEQLQASNAALETTLADLRTTQAQLIHSEKMASIGQLVANVAHEINTPIGAVKSSGRNIAEALDRTLEALPRLFQRLDEDQRQAFMRLIGHRRGNAPPLSTREERALIRDAARGLEAAGIDDARHKAGILVQLNAQNHLADALPLLRHPDSGFILDTARQVAAIVGNTGNINTAVDRVSRIIFALKSFSRADNAGKMCDASLREGIETVLTIYQNPLKQGTELITRFEDIPPVRCLPDELIQVWSNLIHNALQAMNYQGTLTISIRQAGNEAIVSVADTGCGIPDAIRDRIFDPFFTTKPAGEGSGLGLDIVKKIVDKHGGRIEIESAVGQGTTFSVILPYPAAN